MQSSEAKKKRSKFSLKLMNTEEMMQGIFTNANDRQFEMDLAKATVPDSFLPSSI